MSLAFLRPWMSAVAGLVLGGIVILSIPGSMFFVAQAASDDGHLDGRYACPMMDFIGRKPGICPVCGMDLERVTAGDLSREQQRRMGARTARVESGPATVVVRAYGSAQYDDRFSQVVIARIGGRIVKRHALAFDWGQELARGDPIVDIYSPEAFQAQGELAAGVATGDAELVKVIEERFMRWNLAHVAASVRAGGPPVDTVTIVSPAAGQAYLDDQDSLNTTLMVGGEVTADRPLLKLVDPHRLVLVIHVPENRSAFLRAGQSVRLSSDELGDLPEIEAVIGRVANELDPQARTREIRVHLADGRKRLLPGSLVSARVQAVLGPDLTPADPADRAAWGTFPLVPKTAILSTGVRHVAWRVKARKEDGTVQFEPVQVALGPRLEDEAGNDRYVVRAGLKPGDEVATQGLFLIDSQAQLAGTPSLLFPDGAVNPAPTQQP